MLLQTVMMTSRGDDGEANFPTATFEHRTNPKRTEPVSPSDLSRDYRNFRFDLQPLRQSLLCSGLIGNISV